MVDRESQGVSISRTIMADSRNAANVSLNGVAVPSSAVIGELDKGADVLDEALDIARIGLCAEMLGSTLECFERTVDYLKERKQFGRVIGTFQAVSHRAADCFIELECLRLVNQQASANLNTNLDCENDAVFSPKPNRPKSLLVRSSNGFLLPGRIA